MRKNSIAAALAALAAFALLFASCEKRAAQQSAETPAAENAATLGGTVTFLCGTVTMTVSGTANALEIGAKVPVDATVTTDADAICEIQFADFGSVHVDSSSSLTLGKFFSDATHTESEIALNAGKVVCKVRKLAGDDSFQVRTKEMVCGVRGTVFQVARADGEPVKIAVNEGAVAVYPPSVDTAEALPDAAGEAIRECAPVVAAGEEASVEPEAIQALDAAYAAFAEAADDAKAEGGESIEQYKKLCASIVTERAPISEESAETFKDASTLTLAEKAQTASGSATASGSTAESANADGAAIAAKAIVSVTVGPSDAITTINGQSAVKGSFTGKFDAGTTLALATEKEGYETATETITVSSEPEITKTISLAKKSGGAVEAQPAAATPAAAAATPAAAANPKPAARTFAVSQAKLVAVCASGDGGWFASDAKGAVHAVGPDGTILWTAQTGNGTNTLNPPVAGGGVVSFAGDKNLAVFDAATGMQLWALALDKTNTGLYGRHPVIANGKLYLAGDSGLAVYDAKTGAASGSAAFANGSDMSPAYANGTLYIVSKSGTWHKIDAATLAVAKSLETGATQPVASASAIKGNTVVFADRKGTVTAVNADTGALVWQAKLDAAKNVEVFADPVIASGAVFVYAKGSLYALDLATGKQKFAPVAGATSAPCLAKGKLWYGSGSGASASLVGMSPASGAAATKIAVAETVSGTPLVAGSSLVVPLAGGKLLVQPVE